MSLTPLHVDYSSSISPRAITVNPTPETQDTRSVLRWITRLALIFGTLVILPSLKPVRGWLAAPLYVCDEDPTAEVAYVMSDGHAYWERLHGASDLFHMRKINRILIRHENMYSHYNFVKKKNDILYERAIDYLVWKGVPPDAIDTIPVNQDSLLSSLGEAQQIANVIPDLRSVTVVTSAPHTRRSLLCFERSLPGHVQVKVYSPSSVAESWEVNEPIWMEYVKLLVYYLAA